MALAAARYTIVAGWSIFAGGQNVRSAEKSKTRRDNRSNLIGRSKHKAVRRIADPRSGDIWYWKAELATHAEGAEKLGVPYDRRPGEGDILTL